MAKQSRPLCHHVELFLELEETSSERTVIIFQFKKLISSLREACQGLSKKEGSVLKAIETKVHHLTPETGLERRRMFMFMVPLESASSALVVAYC
jgi:hypothetical protein